MHIFLDNFHQGEKYSDQIASHQAELRRKENVTDQKSLSISSLQTDYLNLDSRSGCGRNRLGSSQDVPFALILWYVSKTVYLSLSTNEPRIKNETSGVI